MVPVALKKLFRLEVSKKQHRSYSKSSTSDLLRMSELKRKSLQLKNFKKAVNLRIFLLKKRFVKMCREHKKRELYRINQQKVLEDLRRQGQKIQEKYSGAMDQLEQKMKERFNRIMKKVSENVEPAKQTVNKNIQLSTPINPPRRNAKRKLDFDVETPENDCKIPRMNAFCVPKEVCGIPRMNSFHVCRI